MLQSNRPADQGAARAAPGPVAATLAGRNPPDGLVYVAHDEQRANAVAALLRALDPGRPVLVYPATDALAGGRASRANSGARVAALHALQARPVDSSPVLILPVSATLGRVAAPDAYAAAPPGLAAGDALDPDGFSDLARSLGYREDDRVDEPGEFAVRGGVVEIYPVDAALPVRIVLGDGEARSIDRYDPISQRTVEPVERIHIGRAAEPEDAATATLLDHLPGAAVAVDAGVPERRGRLLDLAGETSGSDRLVDGEAWEESLAGREQLAIDAGHEPPPRFVERRDPAAAFARFARATLADGVLVVVGTPRDLRFLKPRLARRLKREVVDAASWAEVTAAKPGSLLALSAALDRGFSVDGIVAVATADLLGGRAGRADDQPGTVDAFADGEVAPGDLVVHERHGVGRIDGLNALPDGSEGIVLSYARGGRRVVPVGEADRIWRYGADGEAVALDGLDGASWEKRRQGVAEAVAETARALAAATAARAAERTDPIEPDTAAYERFAGGFAFTETADQLRAIDAIRADLASGKPMDRLVVGDVGYGKTEVALRAAAMVALSGRQVAVAAPTTVLVRQHLDHFRRRFADSGIEVAALSRLSTPAEAKRVKAGLADGSIRVVVGTAAVAGKGVAYQDLALVVIDEEQRFGAAQKAKLRALGAGHQLLLSATPIPRTLQSALVGLQAISIIATPPARRQPIRTVVEAWDDGVVRAALLREASRGGQSFVVVPRIEDLDPLEARLRKLVPDFGLVVAHGKLPAADLDQAMVGFANGDGDVLLATNIIEAGLDVPRANTMIVHHADRFGLAQLHQLRGRVGRGGRRGQILLTTEAGASIAPRTLRRLRTLQAFDRLGAGFAISARDLDMRGAGDLLGEEQAGHMRLIGLELHQHMLAAALREARGEPPAPPPPALDLGAAGALPADWIPEDAVRLALYMRLARIDALGRLDQFEEELEDRFGELPPPARRLLDLARLRLMARESGVAAITAGPAAIALTPVDADADWTDAGLARKNDRWIDATGTDDGDARIARTREILEALADR